MEDPWTNAWGDSSKPILPEPSPLLVAPSVSALHAENEDDLSTPWRKSSVTGWGTTTDLSADHIWGMTEISSTTNPPSTFDDISLAGYATQESFRTETQEGGSHPGTPLSLQQLQEVQSPSLAKSFPEPELILPKTLETNVDVDGFGTFETGHCNQIKGSWTPIHSVFPPMSATDSASWDSAWQVELDNRDNAPDDAWEAARKQKERQERHVTPEFLSSILRQFEELSNDLWKDLVTSDAEINDDLDVEMLRLNPFLQRLSSDDMTLPLTVPFGKTFTMKHMSESLKLTRHHTSTRSSPMAIYLASKGSNSWETAVKAKPLVTSDDDIPLGWKTVNSSVQDESPPDDGKKKVGGIFSFFSRRTHDLSVDDNSKRSASPIITSAVTSSKVSTPRAGSPATIEPADISHQSKPPISEFSTVVSAVEIKSALTSETAKDEIQPEVTEPSAVSRFFGRIVGRPKTRETDSLALSADDLEFLADVPTSSNSSGPTNNGDLGIILETPLPLAPRFPAPPSRQESPLPKLPAPPSRPTQSGGNDDLFSLFEPTSLPTTSESLLVTNIPPSSGTPNKIATCQTPISHASSPHQLLSASEEPIKSAPSIDLTSSSSRPHTKSLISAYPPPRFPPSSSGSTIRLNVRQVPDSTVSASIPVLAPSISRPPLRSDQIDDDDEFSDFLSSPAVQNLQLKSFSLDNSKNSSISIPSIKMPDTHHDDFGDFGEVTKPGPINVRSPAAVSISPTQSEGARNRKVSKKADHSRTLSLLESAAARGRWLSPPSPIPEALAPPPHSASGAMTVGRGGLKSNMQTQQALAMDASQSSNFDSEMEAGTGRNIWRLPPPPSGALLQPSVISSTPRLTPPPRPEFVAQPSRPPRNAQLGGLSAQDLSFFEGL